MSKFHGVGRSNFKAIISGTLLIGGFLIAALANQFAVRDHLVGQTSQSWHDRKYDRIWFSKNGTMAGASVEGTNLVVEHWDRSGRDAVRSVVDLGRGALGDANAQNDWLVDSEAQRAAWVSGDQIQVRPLCGGGTGAVAGDACAGASVSIPLSGKAAPVAIGLLAGRRLAVAYADSKIEFWDTETSNIVGQGDAGVDGARQAFWLGDYLAVASDSTLRLLRLSTTGDSMSLVETSSTPAPPFRLLMPAAGQIGYLNSGGAFYRGQTRNSPGAVKTMVLGSGDMLVAGGEFDGIAVLAGNEDPYPLFEEEKVTARVNTVAASGMRLVYSGSGGTATVNLNVERRLTASGRRFNFLGVGLAALGGLLAMSAFLFDLVSMGFKFKRGGKTKKKTSLVPPEDLANAVADGRMVLWAGAGLSIHSGFPLRRTFITQLVQTAESETWIETARMNRYFAMINKGQHEAVLNDLVETLSYDRAKLVAHFRTVYSRLAPLSAAHKMIRQLPVAAAFTTNYDGCLEMMGPQWANATVTLGDGVHRGSAEQDTFFLLKLYGDPRQPDKTLLCQKELAAAAKKDPTLGDTFERLLNSKTLMFIGASLEGLVADLESFPIKKSWTHKHYAIAAAGGGNWEKHVQTLEKLYGIECVICGEEHVATAFMDFLEKLLASVKEIQATRGRPQGGAQITSAVRQASSASAAAD